MSRLKSLKTNIPQVNLADYFFLIAGIPKAGKTTLFAKLVEQYFGDVNKGLLLGFEKGYQALKVNATDVVDWDDYEEIVDELVEEKDSLPYEFIGIDTADIMWDMAQEKVIQEWNSKNPSKRTNDISGVGAKGKSDQGYGDGYNKAKAKIRKTIDKLMKSGYGIMVLTHSKDKEVEEKDGLKYDQLVCSLPGSARDVFINMADFIVFITIEKEKNGNNIETKRYMYFRTDGYVEAGSRFQNVPEKIEYNVDGFVEAFENAIKSEFENGTDIKKIAKEQAKIKEDKAKEFIEKTKTEKELETLPELIEKIKTLMIVKRDAKVKPADIKKALGDIADPNKINDIEVAKGVISNLGKL